MINAINFSPVTATVCSYDLISFTVFTRAISRGGGRSAVKRTHIGRGGCTTILAITVNTWAVAKKSLGLIKCVIRCLDSVEDNNNIDNKLPQSRVTKLTTCPSFLLLTQFRSFVVRSIVCNQISFNAAASSARSPPASPLLLVLVHADAPGTERHHHQETADHR